MIKDLLEQDSKTDFKYLDACLSCYACETACPSGVDYGIILEFARHNYGQSQYTKGFWALVRKFVFKFVLPQRTLLNLLRNFLPFAPRVVKIQPKTKPTYRKIETGKIYRSTVNLTGVERTLSLALGCVMDTLYNSVHWDTIKVLNSCGYHVYIPDTVCCGSLASHSGEYGIGNEQANSMLTELAKHNYPVVFNSAGCGAFTKTEAEKLQVSFKIFDLIEAINQAPVDLLSKLKTFEHEPVTAVYHPACHLNHMQGLSGDYLCLLKQIPWLTLKHLPEADVCCGSAGFYNLIEPKMAEAIGERKAAFIRASGAKIIITANPGCLSQIQAHLGEGYKLMHPVTLLASAWQ
jgi:glycolate oxidase iron-sulfur subunit